jgi:RNA polymerase sigma-70 factor (ECF subfamily)
VQAAYEDSLTPVEYFNSVYTDTLPSVTRFVVAKCGNVLEVEDVVQNIYSRFYSRVSKKGFHDIENAEAFLINLAKFETRNHFGTLKKHSRQSSFADYTEEQMVEIEAEMSRSEKKLEDVLENELLARQIFDDITSGDPEIGKIFYMHFALDMKLDDIAKSLGLNLSTVKNKLYRTIERQKKKFNL